jgi:hypothetical protein
MVSDITPNIASISVILAQNGHIFPHFPSKTPKNTLPRPKNAKKSPPGTFGVLSEPFPSQSSGVMKKSAQKK